MSYQYNELTKQTVVSHAVCGHVISREELHLVIARGNTLQIFAIEQHSGSIGPFSDCDNDFFGNDDLQEVANADGEEQELTAPLVTSDTQNRALLVLIWEEEIHSKVAGICLVNCLSFEENAETDFRKIDYVLLHTEQAKLSLLRWNSDKFYMETVSLHYFEQAQYQHPHIQSHNSNIIVDPQSKCALLRFYGVYWAVLPFTQAAVDLDDIDLQKNLDLDYIEGLRPPYQTSFVIRLDALDHPLTHILDEAFMYEFREPTIAVIYRQELRNPASIEKDVDSVSLVFATISLHDRTVTIINHISDLPSDIYKIIALPSPYAGSLLIGLNEIIHVDGAGRKTAVGINRYATIASRMQMENRSELGLLLNQVVGTPIPDQNACLLVLDDGSIFKLTFQMEGRSVRYMIIDKTKVQGPGSDYVAKASCIALLGKTHLFVGSMVADSIIYRFKSDFLDNTQIENTINDEIDDEPLLDLYGPNESSIQSKKSAFTLTIEDRLECTAPVTDFTIGPLLSFPVDGLNYGSYKPEAQIVAATGEGRAGAITIFQRSPIPQIITQFNVPGVNGVWTIDVRFESGAEMAFVQQVKTYLIFSHPQSVLIFSVGNDFEVVKDSDMENLSNTLSIDTLLKGCVVIQVCAESIHLFNYELRSIQKLNLEDETNDPLARAHCAVIADPYVLILLENELILIFKVDLISRILRRLPLPDALKDFECLTATILDCSDYELTVSNKKSNKTDICSLKRKHYESNGTNSEPKFKSPSRLYCFLFAAHGDVHVIALETMEIVLFTSGFRNLSRHVDEESLGGTGSMIIKESLACYLGDYIRHPYLLLLTQDGCLQAYRIHLSSSGCPCTFTKTFLCMTNANDAEDPEVDRDTRLYKPRLQFLKNTGRHLNIVIIKCSPSICLVKSRKSPLTAIPFSTVKSVASFDTPNVQNGIVFLDDSDVVRICRFWQCNTDTGWATRKINCGKDVTKIAYLPSKKLYAAASYTVQQFVLMDEEGTAAASVGDTQTRLPLVKQGEIRIYDPSNWNVVAQYEFGKYEEILSMKMVKLELNDRKSNRKEFLAVGTGISSGENLPMRGAVYIFDVTSVNPKAGRPDLNKKIRLVRKEEVRGGVSTLAEVKGCLISAQGSKLLVRSIVNQDSLVPVAFYDMSTYVTTVKVWRDVLIIGDLLKGIYLIGFSIEPYKMTLFGKDYQQMSPIASDFMIFEDALQFVVADDLDNIHVFVYDPENSHSLAGQKLLHRADIHVGSRINVMHMLPAQTDSIKRSNVCVGGTSNGSLCFVAPIDGLVYRRLNIVQNQINNNCDHFAGLTPKAWLTCTLESKVGNPLRGIIRANFLKRYCALSQDARKELSRRGGLRNTPLASSIFSLDNYLTYI